MKRVPSEVSGEIFFLTLVSFFSFLFGIRFHSVAGLDLSIVAQASLCLSLLMLRLEVEATTSAYRHCFLGEPFCLQQHNRVFTLTFQPAACPLPSGKVC